MRIRTCASAREFLRVRRTDAETNRWTHTSGSKPGRADRSGQSASALSLFKVRLTLSTVQEKKSMPGPPPVFPGTRGSMPLFLFVSLSLFLFLRSISPIEPLRTQIRKFVELQERISSGQVVPFSDPSARPFYVQVPKVTSMNRILRLLFLIFLEKRLNGGYLDILFLHFRSKSRQFSLYLITRVVIFRDRNCSRNCTAM